MGGTRGDRNTIWKAPSPPFVDTLGIFGPSCRRCWFHFLRDGPKLFGHCASGQQDQEGRVMGDHMGSKYAPAKKAAVQCR